ncbi:hypothetical protein BGZ49_007618 [Haplosporangium sp. Z 27]|nr:hypothetical protein BGZ49_007618 [Haplosporangium sp. Z 27]
MSKETGRADSALQLQEMSAIPKRGQYEALETVDKLKDEKCAPLEIQECCEAAQRSFFTPNSILKTRPNVLSAAGEAGYVGAIFSAQLSANFNDCSAGFYIVRWRVKLLEDFRFSHSLHFAVNVSYDAELSNVIGTFDAQMRSGVLTGLDKNLWRDLELEEKLVIHPHVGKARVQVVLSNNEGEGHGEYSGMVIDYAEIKPILANTPEIPNVPINLVKKRVASPKFTIAPIEASPDAWPYDLTQMPITRLSVSAGSRFLASLALSKDVAVITVWDMSQVRNRSKPSLAESKSVKRAAIAAVQHQGIGDLAVGLSLSDSGDQVVIYQEPKIGEWAAKSQVLKASFSLKIFNNPLVRQSAVFLNLEGPSNSNTSGIDNTTNTPPGTMALQPYTFKNEILPSFIGYAGFLPETKKEDWEKNDLNSTLFGPENMEAEGSSENLVDEENSSSNISRRSMFVACNGLYLDVFEISPENTWRRMHTITLTDLLPTLSRRITCKMMIESISSNTFMWLEDNGLCCTIWNVMNGSNVSYISSLENSRFKGPTFRGHSKMAMSPHESIVVLASIDGSVATYFANTGLAIDERPFPGYKVEYVGFHGQDNHIFIILRNVATFELSSRILDTFQLKSETIIENVPIPTIGLVVHAFFNTKGFRHRGVICEADGSNISCYISYQQKSLKVNTSSQTVIKADKGDVSHNSFFDEHIKYHLRTGFHQEPLPEGDGMSYWVLRVEVVEENTKSGQSKLIFSFIPEPWMRVTVSEIRDPKNLLKAYFTPSGLRFAVVGVQTLQIWNLPIRGNSKCTLEYIWSQPNADKYNTSRNPPLKPRDVRNYYSDITSRNTPYKSRDVRNYYSDISSASIYVEASTGNAVAEIKTVEEKTKQKVIIPGADNDTCRWASLYCFHSIHLLAAAYTYAIGESKKSTRDIPQVTLTFEDHAEAIVRFTHRYINRMISHAFYSSAIVVSHQSSPPIQTDSKDITNSETRSQLVTIFTLLLDEPQLKSANHTFVEGLLSTEDGEWVPRDDEDLNPIRRAICSRDVHLVETFIDYCIRNAKKYHPAYMTPAIQCLSDLLDRYPNILDDMFKKASYVPAHNHAYVSSHAIVANRRYGDYINFLANYFSFKLWRGKLFNKSHNINDYYQPVFSLRNQLPIRAVGSYNIVSIETAVIERRSEVFPENNEAADEEQNRIQSKYSHRVYVCPFPKSSNFGPYQAWYNSGMARSTFTDIAGQEVFKSPAMIATLQFKWHMYGFFHWVLRFLVAVAFFICITLITAEQIRTSTLPDPLPGSNNVTLPTAQQIEDRYMFDWHPFIKITISIGALLVIFDIQRLFQDPAKYIRKPKPSEDGPDSGPSQIWVMSFAILALYIDMLFELRVVKQLGIVVNVILNITRRITWLFLVFGLFLVGFTHALLHLLHTRSYNSQCIYGTCDDKDYPDGYPKGFLGALSATYFFLAGRYDPISTSFDNGSISFHIMMVIFFFFTTVLLLNILIALMNDAFNESSEQGELAWLKQWSQVISDVELSYLSNGSRQNRNYFPDYIYYVASEKDAELYESQYTISNKSNLSIENRFVIDAVSMEQNATHLAQRAIIKDVQGLGTSLVKVEDEVSHEISDVKALVQQSENDLAQELAEMKKLMLLFVTQSSGITPPTTSTAPIPVSDSPTNTSAAVNNPLPPPISTSKPLGHEKLDNSQGPIVASPSMMPRYATMPGLGSAGSEAGPSVRNKPSYSLLRDRIKKKLASTHMNDGNDASNPVYVTNTQSGSSHTNNHDDSDDSDASNDEYGDQ